MPADTSYEFDEIVHPDDISKICDGLGHRIRANIHKILSDFIEKTKESCPIVYIVDRLAEIGIKRSYQAVREHLDIMEKAGIVTVFSEDDDTGKRIKVDLVNEIEIHSWESIIKNDERYYKTFVVLNKIFTHINIPNAYKFFSESEIWEIRYVRICDFQEIADICDALGHPTRVKIYEKLLNHELGFFFVTDLKEFGKYSVLAIHLKKLKDAGLIEYKKYPKLRYIIYLKKIVKIYKKIDRKAYNSIDSDLPVSR